MFLSLTFLKVQTRFLNEYTIYSDFLLAFFGQIEKDTSYLKACKAKKAWKTSLGLRVTVFILTGVTNDAPERELRVHTRMSNIIWRSVPVVRRRRGPRCHGLVSARCIRDPLPRKLCDSGGGKSGVAGSTFRGSDRLWLWRLIYATGSNSTRSSKGVKVTQCHCVSPQQE